MKTKILWTLLAVSILFNLCFAASYLKARRTWKSLRTPAGRFRLITERLELDARQQAQYDRLWAQTRSKGLPLWEEGQERRQELWHHLDQDPPDTEALHVQVQDSMELQTRAQLLALDHLLELMSILEPEQRRQLLEMVQRSRALPGD